jgi:UDP-N-acetylmuramyl pentapeptide synthase
VDERRRSALGFFASVDAIADAKAEILEGRRVRRCSSPTPTTTGSRAPRAFAGRVVTFGIDRAADVARRAIVDRGIDGTRARVDDAARQRRDDDAARRPRQSGERPRGDRRAPRVRRAAATIARARARCGRRAPRRSRRLPSGVTIIDDSYNANPTATQRRSTCWRGAGAAADRGLGEMLELGDRREPARGRRPRGRGAASTCCCRRRRAGAALARRRRRGHAGRSVRYFATSDEAAEPRPRSCAPAISCW